MCPVPLLEIRVETLEEALLIRPRGEIDMSTVGALETKLAAARRDGRTTVLDLSEISFMDSHGLRVVMTASRDATAAGCSFLVVRPSLQVRRLLEVTGTLDALQVVTDGADGHPDGADGHPDGADGHPDGFGPRAY